MEGGRTEESLTLGYKSIPDFYEHIDFNKKTGSQFMNCNPVL